MNSEDDSRLAAVRAILANPEFYIICEGCGSICKITLLEKDRIACPNCNGYAFDIDPARVTEQTKKLLVSGRSSVQPEDLQ